VLLTCDRMGLIGREMFAIDGVSPLGIIRPLRFRRNQAT